MNKTSGCLDNGYQTFVNGYIYTFDSDQNGWHIQRLDRGEGDFPAISPVVYGFPVLSMGQGVWGDKRVLGTFEKRADKVMPKTFVIPDTVENMKFTFFMSKLKVIDNDFKLPKNVKDLSFAFSVCYIEIIPEGFRIPEGVLNTTGMFGVNYDLKTVGDGFFIPDSVKHADIMFTMCELLTTIPEDFSLCSHTTQEEFFKGTPLNIPCVKLREPKR